MGVLALRTRDGRVIGIPGLTTAHLSRATSKDAWPPIALFPEGWWRADRGVTRLGVEVTDYVNQGPEPDLDLMQGVGTMRPDFVAIDAAFGGMPSIHYDSNDILASIATIAWELAADGDDFTVIAIVVPDSAAALETAVAVDDNLAIGRFRLQPRTGSTSRFSVKDSLGVAVTDRGTALTASMAYALAGVYTGAVSPSLDSAAFWVDGVSIVPSTADQGVIAAGVGGPSEFIHGGNVIGVGNFNGRCAEVIYLKGLLTVAEDAALTAYFNDRYGFTLPGVTQ